MHAVDPALVSQATASFASVKGVEEIRELRIRWFGVKSSLQPSKPTCRPLTCEMSSSCSLRPGSVVVDIAIDSAGAFETGRPTTHSEPTYVEEDVVHYFVANIPGAVARSTFSLTSATLPSSSAPPRRA
jgi:hypothetical protein